MEAENAAPNRAAGNPSRLRELEAIAHVASSFTFEQPLEAMMDDVARQAVLASGSALACIVGLADRGTQQVTRVLGSHGLPPGFRETLEEAWRLAGTPLVSGPIQSRNTQVFEIAAMPTREGYEAVREAQRRAGWAVMAAVPMVYRGQAIGLVIVPYPPGLAPDSAEVAFLEAISDQAAVGLENARLFEQARAAAVVEERRRISRELHDSVSQALYGISLGAQTARELLDIDPASAAEPMDYVQLLAEAGLAEMRALIFELRPEALASEGIAAALARQATALRTRHHISVGTELIAEPAVSLESKQVLYRVAQEALQNVVKHARATSVEMSLRRENAWLVLEIRDNGRGFVIADDYPGHLGLTSMRERARGEGGSIEIESVPGSGSTVRLRLPG